MYLICTEILEIFQWNTMKLFGKSSKVLIVRILFTCMKYRYPWKQPPFFFIEGTGPTMLETDVNVNQ